jgi:hypothetical protein
VGYLVLYYVLIEHTIVVTYQQLLPSLLIYVILIFSAMIPYIINYISKDSTRMIS